MVQVQKGSNMVRISIVRLLNFINATAEAAITDHGQK